MSPAAEQRGRWLLVVVAIVMMEASMYVTRISGAASPDSSCLYVSSGSLEVYVLDPTSPEEPLLLAFTAGAETTGVIVHEGILYVASPSESTINMFDVNDNLTALGTFVAFAELFYLEQIVIHEGMMYVATDDFPYVLKVPLGNVTNDPAFHTSQWQPTGGGIASYWAPAGNIALNPIKGAAWGLVSANISGNSQLFVTSQANEIFSITSNYSGYDSITPYHQDTATFGPLRWAGMDVDIDGVLTVAQGRGGQLLRFDPSGTVLNDYAALGAVIFDAKFASDGQLYVIFASDATVANVEADGNRTDVFASDVGMIYMSFGACPLLNLPSPTPSPGTPSSSSTSDTTVILASVIPSIFVGLLLLFCFVGVLFYAVIWRDRRRKWYDDRNDHELSVVEIGQRRYVYREIDPKDLQLGHLLGAGGFAKVYRGSWRGAPVAVKIFDQVDLNEVDENTLDGLRREAEMLEKLSNHPNIVSFVGAITKGDDSIQGIDKRPFALVLEFYPYGSLFDLLISKKTELPFHLIVRMARDIALGILHLHKEQVIHRDIACRNVLCGKNYSVHISDFGLARVKKDEVDRTTSNYGAVKWMAPEALLRGEYSEASDCFSYGVLLWEMVTRKSPWSNVDPTQIAIAVGVKNTRLRIPPTCDPVFRRIMMSCWKQNPSKRMKMEEISDILQQYYADLAKYADEEWNNDMYEDGEVEDVRSFSSNSLHFQSTHNVPVGGASSASGSSGSTSVSTHKTSAGYRSNSRALTRVRQPTVESVVNKTIEESLVGRSGESGETGTPGKLAASGGMAEYLATESFALEVDPNVDVEMALETA